MSFFKRYCWLLLGCGLILLTRLAFVLKGPLHFDSDQAIMGLMASDIAEGKSFPFYFWGQRYLMALESWWVAPFFWFFGATITTLKFPLLLLNLFTYLILYESLVRSKEASFKDAFLILLPLTSTSVVLSSRLVEAQGANIEPLLYVSILWLIRTHPFLLGALSGIFFVHREFSLYPLVALLICHYLFSENSLKKKLTFYFLVFVTFVSGVVLLKSLGNQLTPIGIEVTSKTLSFGKPLKCFWNVISDTLPAFFGFESHSYREFNLLSDISALPVAVRWLGILFLFGIILKSFYLLKKSRLSFFKQHPLPFYWLLTGGLALMAYVFISPGDDLMTFRYQLVGIYFFLGLFALVFHTQLRTQVLCVLICFALLNSARAIELAWEQFSHPPHDEYSELAEALAHQHLTIGWGDYWVSYYLTFASKKSLFFATKNSRTPDWEKIIEISPERKVTIQKEPCTNGNKVVKWYLCN